MKNLTALICPPCAADEGVDQPVGKWRVPYQCPRCDVQWWTRGSLADRIWDLRKRLSGRRSRTNDHHALDRAAGRMLADTWVHELEPWEVRGYGRVEGRS